MGSADTVDYLNTSKIHKLSFITMAQNPQVLLASDKNFTHGTVSDL